MVHTVTSALSSPADDQAHRRHRYLLMMGIRVACFALMLVFDGWMRWVCIAGAVLIPYFAVIGANAVAPRQRGVVPGVTPQPHQEIDAPSQHEIRPQ